jgi:transposase InsO family protein
MQTSGQSEVREKKGDLEPEVRTAEQPGQALNIDLCFVPEQHEAQEKLPAVSGSSGHLVIERVAAPQEPPHWPGQVFGTADLTYEMAMQQYVQATQDRQVHAHILSTPQVEASTRWRQEWEGRAERHAVLQRRKQEDAAWKAAKAQHRADRLAFQQRSKAERRQQQAIWQAKQAAWHALREQRRLGQPARQAENQAWHERNRKLKAGSSAPLQEPAWVAMLVVTDNCTRQCLGLPLFRSGPKVTSQEVIDALGQLLPAQLQFLISDQGAHFRTKKMARLAEAHDFLHVLIYRHRPQTNGIAERFVLTLKQWLRSHAWLAPDELENLLKRFQPEYNHRPHQGLGIPGLSPNEFANRIWLM